MALEVGEINTCAFSERSNRHATPFLKLSDCLSNGHIAVFPGNPSSSLAESFSGQLTAEYSSDTNYIFHIRTNCRPLPMRQPRVFHLMQRAHGALFRAADKHLRSHENISASQHGILILLATQDGVTSSEIANQLGIGKSSLSGLIDRMVSAGLVCRVKSQEDGRVQHLHVTNRGRGVVDRTLPGVRVMNRRLLEPFNKDERATIARFLNHIADHAYRIVYEEHQQSRKQA